MKKLFCLELEDLVFNALIELVESKTSQGVSYSTAMQYGKQIIKELENRGISAIIVPHRDKTIQFENEYKRIFDFHAVKDGGYVTLKENIDTEYLRDNFRVRQAFDTVIAMTSDESRKVLGIKKK